RGRKILLKNGFFLDVIVAAIKRRALPKDFEYFSRIQSLSAGKGGGFAQTGGHLRHNKIHAEFEGRPFADITRVHNIFSHGEGNPPPIVNDFLFSSGQENELARLDLLLASGDGTVEEIEIFRLRQSGAFEGGFLIDGAHLKESRAGGRAGKDPIRPVENFS